MKSLLIVLFLCTTFAHAAPPITPTDMISAVNVVSSKFNIPVWAQVMHNTKDPLAASYRPLSNACEVYISAKYVNYLSKLVADQPLTQMLEGFAAHEISHCVDMKQAALTGGVTRLAQYNSDIDFRVQAELFADIVSIMYWKQEYPTTAHDHIATMVEWRKKNDEIDPQHATYKSLIKALPLIPARVDFGVAYAIRDKVK